MDEIFAAIENHDVSALSAALTAGADPNARSMSWPNVRPLGAAIEEVEFDGPVESVSILIGAGADVDLPYAGELRPVHAAMCLESVRVVELLVAAGVDVTAETPLGESPLRFAAGRGHHAIVEVLLRNGAAASIDARSWLSGETALDRALAAGDCPMAELLRSHGARDECSRHPSPRREKADDDACQ